jgi:Fe-S-cluster containining protein
MKLPCDECGGKCCTFPAMSKREYKTLRKKYGVPKSAKIIAADGMVIVHKEDGYCPYLTGNGCGVYDDRPQTCRLYGEVPQMPCQYLYPVEAERVARASYERMQESIGPKSRKVEL